MDRYPDETADVDRELDHPRQLELSVDPLLEALGHEMGGPYFARFWVPLVGPSVAVLCTFTAARAGESMTLRRLGQSIGLGRDLTERTRKRAEVLRLLDVRSDAIAVVGFVAPLTERQVQRLPTWLAEEHRKREG